MKISDEAFKELYQNELAPKTAKLEKLRHDSKVGCFYVTIPLVTVTAILWFQTYYWNFTMISLAVASILAAVYAIRKSNEYGKKFKNQVVKQIVALINPTWQTFFDLPYAKEHKDKLKSIQQHWEQSHLEPSPSHLHSAQFDDHIKGTIDGKTPLECTEIKVSKGSGDTKSTVFRGLFLQMDFQKTCIGQTLILPKDDEKNREKSSITTGSYRGNGFFAPLVKTTLDLTPTNHTRFDLLFSVYSNSPQTLNDILPPALLDILIEITEAFQTELMLSFTQNQAYCIIKSGEPLFEVELFKNSLSVENAQEMYNYFAIVQEITKAIKTHTRVWNEE